MSVALRREVHYGNRVIACLADRPPDIDAMFRRTVAEDRAAPTPTLAIVDGAIRLDYAALDTMVDRAAAHLAARGVAPGDRVAALLGNGAPIVVLLLACARRGAILVPMNIRQRAPEIAYMLADSGATVLVHEAALAGELPDVSGLRQRFSVDGAADGADAYDTLLQPIAALAHAAPAEDAPLCILYTSGTTGRPKGAVLTHLGMVHSALNYEHGFGLRRGDRAALAVPASHVTGLVAMILAMIRVGGCTVMMAAFKARAFLELVAAERVTYSLMVPAMYNLCLLDPEIGRFDLASWRVGGFGGAPMPEATIAALAHRLPGLVLHNVYGSTETTSPVTLLPARDIASRADSVGLALPGCDIRVMDPDGREVAPGEGGELWIAGPMVVPGYWGNPAATEAGFVQGYWRSGDVGSVDAAGYVRVFDRTKDMINRGGFKIYSVEVENVLSHHPDVIEAAIVGRPCPVLGERVAAFVVTRGEIDASALRRFCAERLSDYKVPEFVSFEHDPLPRNANGKLQKSALRARPLGEGAAP